MRKIIILLIFINVLFIISCNNKNTKGKNDSNMTETVNNDLNITEAVNEIMDYEIIPPQNASMIKLNGITDYIYLDSGDKYKETDYKMNTVNIECYNKNETVSPRRGFIYFNGGLYDRDMIIYYNHTQTQKRNQNNVYYFDYYLFSANEYSDIRFERNIFINTENYIIIITIELLNYDLIREIIRENSQYFKIWDGEKRVEYDEGLLNELKHSAWTSWDHENNATEHFIENIVSNEKNIAVLWKNETEEIVNSIILE